MGMYDYAEGQQVKCFYTPIINLGTDKLEITELPTWHSSGNLYSYKIGDELPIKTLYYNYTDDFIIVNMNDNEYKAVVVKGKKLKALKDWQQLNEDDFGNKVIGYYGQELNIKNKKDIEDMYKDIKAYKGQIREIEYSYFKNGAFTEMKNNMENYDKYKKEYLKKLHNLQVNG